MKGEGGVSNVLTKRSSVGIKSDPINSSSTLGLSCLDGDEFLFLTVQYSAVHSVRCGLLPAKKDSTP